MAQVISLYGVQTLQPTTDNNFSLIVNTNTRGENTNEVRLLVDTSAQVVASPVNIYLPTILSYNGFWTTQIYVVDISGTASGRPIRIYSTGGDTINGTPMVEINTDFGNSVVVVANAGSWASYGNTSGSGGGSNVVTTTYADFYSTMSGGNLVAGTMYRITDYQSSNYINGWRTADNNPPPITLDSGTRISTYNNPPNPSTFFPFAVFTLSDGSCLVGTSSGALRKFDPNGNEIASFTTNTGLGGNGNAIYSIAVQSDGKIIVSGNFNNWDGNVVGGIARLNPNGTYDATFTTNIGSGFDTTIFSVAVQSDDKIVVGGTFTLLNGNPQNYFARLNSDGTDDAVFNANVMSLGSFNSQVSQIIIEPLGSFLVLGSFNSYNGNPTSQITRLDNLGNSDFIFDANLTFGGGFVGGQPLVMALQNDGSIVLGGSFTGLNFTTSNRIIRLLSDGSEDAIFSFNANTFVGANNTIYQIVIRPSDGNIYFFGDVTTYNAIPVSNAFALDTNGFSISFSGYASGLSTVGIYSGAVLQPTTENILFCSQPIANVVAITTVPIPFTAFDPRQVYTSPNVETLVVKAVDNVNIEPIAFSEQYPQDIINYLPQVNNLGFSLNVFNGQTLPDTSIVAGFDLQWDGTRAYFDMPTGYPVEMGHYFYVFCDFSDSTILEAYCEPIFFGINQTQNFGADVTTTIEVVNNQTRVYLNDITNAKFLLYNPNSLYVDTIYADVPCKGWMLNRVDNSHKIEYPSDWRNQVFRRYAISNPSYGIILYYIPTPTFLNAEAFNPNGGYVDYNPLDWRVGNFYDVVVSGTGYTTNYWYGQVDNNVILSASQVRMLGVFESNYFYSLNNVSSLRGTYYNSIFNISTATFLGELAFNFYTSTSFIDYSTFLGNVFYNLSNSGVSICQILGIFSYNSYLNSPVFKNVFGDYFRDNKFIGSPCNNAVFGVNTEFNIFTNTTIINWESGLEMSNNSFNQSSLNNTKIGANCNFNTVNGSSWQSNDFGNSFQANQIDSPIFDYNIIDKLCVGNVFNNSSTVSRNIIGQRFTNNSVSNFFRDNTLGAVYQNNQFSGSFQFNVGGDESIGNIYLAGFQQNVFGYRFGNNNFQGTFTNNIWENETLQNEFNGLFINNHWGSNCSTNEFTANQCVLNQFGGNFTQNAIKVNRFDQNIFVGNFGLNTIGTISLGTFSNNTINVQFGNNTIGDVNFTGNTIIANSFQFFDGNTIDSSFVGNNLIGGFQSCQTAGGLLVTFGYNDIRTNTLTVDFTLATFVYTPYSKMVVADNLNNQRLLYFDNATLTWISVTPINS